MIEGYVYSYAVIIQNCPEYGEDELDEEYLDQNTLDHALAELRATAGPGTTYRYEWRVHM